MVYDFYRPHDREATWYTGETVDPYTGQVTSLPSMTKQSFAAECDINNILKQYKVTGMVQHITAKAAQGAYQDLPDPLDFQESLNIVQAGKASFASLPSKIRARFGNDPAEFLEFCSDPSNAKELVELGLATAQPQAGDTAPVPASPAPASPGAGGSGG